MQHSLTQLTRKTGPSLLRAGKAAVIAVAASLPYIVGWEVATRAGLVSAQTLAVTAGCVLVGSVVTALGFRLAGLHRPTVGGVYVGVLLVVYAVLFLALYGPEAITWAAWPAIAAQLAVIYAIQQGATPQPQPARRIHVP